MYTLQEIIIRSYKQGESQRKISKELQVNRKTVKRYIDLYELQAKEASSNAETQVSFLSCRPVYHTGNRPKIKLTQDVEGVIDELLALNEQKKKQGLKKQQLKKKDILEELHKRGFDIGYTSVCTHISNKLGTPKPQEAFIRQIYSPGSVCEFDWGEIRLNIFGVQTRLQLAVFTSAYGNHRMAYIYHRQDSLSFMEAHVRYFREIGGVFREIVYDNMRVAIAKFVGKYEKEPTQALLALRAHYQFSHRFCNIYRGNEKGHVERSVEYVRRKSFALKDSFDDIDQAQIHLNAVLTKLNNEHQKATGKTAHSLLQEEKLLMAPTPRADMLCSQEVQLRVDKYATVSYKTNRYSVPDHLVGDFIDLKVFSREVHIYHKNVRMFIHPRSYQIHQWVINIEHYLNTFKKKPGALPGSVALASNTYLKTLYVQYFSNVPRDFIELLGYCREYMINDERLEDSVRRLVNECKGEITVEKLRALLGNSQTSQSPTRDDSICLMAKQQLAIVTGLMN
jgi:transposase